MQSERDVRLAEIKKLEAAEAAEEAARMRASKEGGKGAFMREQEKALYGGGGGGMDLAEQLGRGQSGWSDRNGRSWGRRVRRGRNR
ncbi:hypothetical protein FRC08_009079 [Ceratobasidium sp. 394]|nr:hypothetical protein FRC08_009079 [Ceratobasidium sp. 394]